MLLLRYQLHLMLRTPWSLPLHPTMVGLQRQLHQCLRAMLPRVRGHRVSSTLHPQALLIHQRCLARQKSRRGNFCAAENLAQYAIKHVADMHLSFRKTRISLHPMFTIAASNATGLLALRPTKLLHRPIPPAILLRTPRTGIIHQTPQGRGSSRPPGRLAIGNGTRGTSSGPGTDRLWHFIAVRVACTF